jgi:1-acyl-sn-glycerol-3-phosphate acyltransferase
MLENANLETYQPSSYNHQKLERKRRLLRFLIKNIGFTLLAKLDGVEGLENVPKEGPVILMINHINIIDPVVVIHTLPRNIVPLAKIEVFSYPLIGIFPKMWEVIPVKRDEFDRQAIHKVMEVLHAGEIVLVAPEGTRGTALQRGKEGIAYIASRSNVPVIPVGIDGTTGFPALRFTSRWRGPGVFVRFGKPFSFDPALKRATRDDLRRMTDEAMFQLAVLLPPERRGYYSDLSKATQDTLKKV